MERMLKVAVYWGFRDRRVFCGAGNRRLVQRGTAAEVCPEWELLIEVGNRGRGNEMGASGGHRL